jgi:putative membrane protein
MPRASRLLCLALLAVGIPTLGAENPQTTPPLGTASFTPPEANIKSQALTPETFVTRAAVANMAEIEASQLALERSADADLRKYATRVIEDHQRAQSKLKTIAASAKIALPGAVDAEHRAEKERLAELTGADFDKRYISMMHAGHQQATALFESATQSAQLQAPLKSYADETLKTVQLHASEAEKLHKR